MKRRKTSICLALVICFSVIAATTELPVTTDGLAKSEESSKKSTNPTTSTDIVGLIKKTELPVTTDGLATSEESSKKSTNPTTSTDIVGLIKKTELPVTTDGLATSEESSTKSTNPTTSTDIVGLIKKTELPVTTDGLATSEKSSTKSTNLTTSTDIAGLIENTTRNDFDYGTTRPGSGPIRIFKNEIDKTYWKTFCDQVLLSFKAGFKSYFATVNYKTYAGISVDDIKKEPSKYCFYLEGLQNGSIVANPLYIEWSDSFFNALRKEIIRFCKRFVNPYFEYAYYYLEAKKLYGWLLNLVEGFSLPENLLFSAYCGELGRQYKIKDDTLSLPWHNSFHSFRRTQYRLSNGRSNETLAAWSWYNFCSHIDPKYYDRTFNISTITIESVRKEPWTYCVYLKANLNKEGYLIVPWDDIYFQTYDPVLHPYDYNATMAHKVRIDKKRFRDFYRKMHEDPEHKSRWYPIDYLDFLLITGDDDNVPPNFPTGFKEPAPDYLKDKTFSKVCDRLFRGRVRHRTCKLPNDNFDL